MTTLDLAGTWLWMYNNLFRSCRKLTSLRDLYIYMNVGHVITFNSYKVVRTCVLQNNPQFEDIPTLELLQTTNTSTRTTVGTGDECVLQRVQNSLQGRGVEVMVPVVSAGSRRLKDDDTHEFL